MLTRALRGVALQISPAFVATDDELRAMVAGLAEAVARGRDLDLDADRDVVLRDRRPLPGVSPAGIALSVASPRR